MGKAHLVGIGALATLIVAARLSWWGGSAAAPSLIFIRATADEQGRKAIGEPGTRPQHSYLVAASADKKPLTVLTPQLAAVRDPEVSYDGQRVLFAGKRAPEEPWQIWEVQRDGHRLRQVTHERGDCTEPHYLPDERLVFRSAQGNTNALYTCALDGTRMARITFNVDPLGDTSVLPDGRILFATRGKWCTVNLDGTGIAPFTSNPEPVRAAHAQQIDNPIRAAPRPRPMGHASVVDTTKNTGKLFCLNAYLSDRPNVAALPAGTIKKVRVWAAAPQPRVLGDAPVERDGSFFLEVPADTPLRLQTLAEGDRVLGRLATWIWVRPNESRGCIGCHEDRDLVPENEVPLAVTRPATRLAAPAGGEPGGDARD